MKRSVGHRLLVTTTTVALGLLGAAGCANVSSAERWMRPPIASTYEEVRPGERSWMLVKEGNWEHHEDAWRNIERNAPSAWGGKWRLRVELDVGKDTEFIAFVEPPTLERLRRVVDDPRRISYCIYTPPEVPVHGEKVVRIGAPATTPTATFEDVEATCREQMRIFREFREWRGDRQLELAGLALLDDGLPSRHWIDIRPFNAVTIRQAVGDVRRMSWVYLRHEEPSSP